jgi:DNA-binding NarL/FixJ family response regulator
MDALAQAIRLAHQGETRLAPEVQEQLDGTMTRSPLPGHDLTERERAVLSLMAAGLSNPAIGKQLRLSQAEVEDLISSILAKLGIAERAKAVAVANTIDLGKHSPTGSS